MARLFLSLLDAVNRVVCWLAGTLFALATIAVLVQVAVRFVLPKFGFSVSAPWTEESARYLVAWSVFLGVAVLCRHARLIAVDIFAFALPEPYGKAVRFASLVLTAFFFVCLLTTGMEWTAMSPIEASPVLRIPMTWVYSSMPVGSALALINLLGLLVARATNGNDVGVATADLAGD